MKRKVTTVFLSFCILAIINSLTVSAETGIRWSPAPTGPSRHTEPRLPELRRERSMSAFPIRRVPVHVLVDQQWISGDIHRNPFNPNGNPNYRQTTFDIIFAATDVYWQEFSLDIHGSGVITRWHSPNTLDGEVLLANARAHGLAGQRLQIAFSGRRFIQFFDRDNNEWIEIGGLASFRDWGVLVLDFGTHNRAISHIDLIIEQFPYGEISRSDVLRNTIRELVIIQESERFGIYIYPEEIIQLMESFQSVFPEIFEEALDIYGYYEFAFGLMQRRLYWITKDYIIYHEILPYIEMGDDILLNHLRHVGAEDIELNNDTYYIIKNHFIEYTLMVEFERLKDELYQKANIVYYIEF